MKNEAAMYLALGEASLSGEDLLRHLDEILGEETATPEKSSKRKTLDLRVGTSADGWFSLAEGKHFKFRVPGGQKLPNASTIAYSNLEFSTPVQIAPEGVVPGDRLVGILPEGGPLTIYPIGSDALPEFDESPVLWIDVLWSLSEDEDTKFSTVLAVHSVNKPGILAQITSAIATAGANISNLVSRSAHADFNEMLFELDLTDITQLNDVIATLNRIVGVAKVLRATAAEAEVISSMSKQYNEIAERE
jgi:guanosine-3',5'-bis(diphosphate) 3'-pyrophosphohydrolase